MIMMTIENLTDRINARGVKINTSELLKEISIASHALGVISSTLTCRVASALGIPCAKVRLNSSKQMVDFFYGYHCLPVTNLTTKGRTPSLDSDTLSPFADSNIDVRDYIQFRSISKNLHILKNLEKEIVHGDEIHSDFNCDGAISGRFTSSAPNLQQIPSAYRKFFIPRKGFKFLCIDLKQAELSLAYQLAGAKVTGDVHSLVANQLGIPRDKAKIFNLGVSYGMTSYGLAKLLGCSLSLADKYISDWKFSNKELVDYIEKINLEAAMNGFVGIYDNSKVVRDDFKVSSDPRYQSYRAFNIHVQGSLAKLVKLAMVKIQSFLDEVSPNSHIVLTVHDELVIELSESALEHVSEIVKMFENIDGFSFDSTSYLCDSWCK